MAIDTRLSEMTLEELRPHLIKRLDECARGEYIDFLDWAPWESVREEHKSKFAFMLYMMNTLMAPDHQVLCLLFGNCDDDKAFFAFTDRAAYEQFISQKWPFVKPTVQD